MYIYRIYFASFFFKVWHQRQYVQGNYKGFSPLRRQIHTRLLQYPSVSLHFCTVRVRKETHGQQTRTTLSYTVEIARITPPVHERAYSGATQYTIVSISCVLSRPQHLALSLTLTHVCSLPLDFLHIFYTFSTATASRLAVMCRSPLHRPRAVSGSRCHSHSTTF